METTNRRLHPLLVAAAISLMIFSAVGVAALSGLIPQSKGSVQDEPVAAAPASMPAAAPAAAPRAPAPHVAAARPARKALAKAPTPRPAEPIVYRDFDEPAPRVVAQAPRTVEASKPVVKPGVLATVVDVREVETDGDAKGVGAVAGGLAGAVFGHNIGENNKVVTVLGAAGGALLGNQIEKKARATKRWEMTLRMDDGTTQVIQSEAQPYWTPGERVRLHEGRVQPV